MGKIREAKFQEQLMGRLPEAKLKSAPVFNNVMVDLPGPYSLRGEVQKRTSGKAYGVIYADIVMRAVHIEVGFGYDTESFLMALSRFVSGRGLARNYSQRSRIPVGWSRVRSLEEHRL